MMKFRTIDKALTDLLIANANGAFHVETAQRRALDADYIKAHPIVTVFYEQGNFQKGSGGPIFSMHDMTFRIEVMVAQSATVDLRTLNDPNATAQQIASAIAASTSATVNADDLLDQTLENVYQIIRDPRNYDLGLPVGTVSSPWVGAFQKDNPLHQGELVVLAGSWSFTCRATEVTKGATPVTLATVDTSIKVTADQSGSTYDSAKQGAEVNQ